MGVIKMEGEFLDGDLLRVSVLAEEIVQPVLGLAFHLEYSGDDLAFLRYDPGEFLERGGDPFYIVKNDEEKAKVIFGETLRRDDAFPLGEGRIVDFYFQIIGERELHFSFDRAVLSSMDTQRQDIDKIEWEDLYLDGESTKSATGGGASFAQPTTKNSYLLWVVGALASVTAVLLFVLLRKINQSALNKRAG